MFWKISLLVDKSTFLHQRKLNLNYLLDASVKSCKYKKFHRKIILWPFSLLPHNLWVTRLQISSNLGPCLMLWTPIDNSFSANAGLGANLIKYFSVELLLTREILKSLWKNVFKSIDQFYSIRVHYFGAEQSFYSNIFNEIASKTWSLS